MTLLKQLNEWLVTPNTNDKKSFAKIVDREGEPKLLLWRTIDKCGVETLFDDPPPYACIENWLDSLGIQGIHPAHNYATKALGRDPSTRVISFRGEPKEGWMFQVITGYFRSILSEDSESSITLKPE